MGLLDDCENYFGNRDLYEILHLQTNCSKKDVQKAYRKLSLLVHPDRVEEDEKEEATKKFQVLAKIHFTLCDKEKRAVYDDTGEVDEEDDLSEDKNWMEYWRLLFPKIKEKDIVKCLSEYRGSDDEKADLKNWYVKFKGDMDKISEYLIGYTFEDEDRYKEVIGEMIETEEVPEFKKFMKESAAKKKARQRRNAREAMEAEKMKEEADSAEASLVDAIQKRSNQRFDDMISHLENKYAKKTSSSAKGKKKKPPKN